MKRKAVVLALGLTAGFAIAQMNPQDHAAHHPDGAASAPVVSPAASRTAVAPGQFDKQMQMMQDMHKRMQAAKTPAEKQALMAEHMKLMQSGMEMMSKMGQGGAMDGMGGMGSGPMPGASAAAMPGATQPAAQGMQGMGGMMAMHGSMEQRRAMMEQMMQMMVDREAAMPRR